jgi:Tfp pilus assembly protein PilN
MIKINLLPVETKVQIPKAFQHIAMGVVVLLIGMGGIGYVWAQTNAHYEDKKNEAAKKEKIAKELDAIIAEVNRFKKVKADLEEKLDTIQNLKDNQKGPLRLLIELRDRFPKQVWVSRITYKKDLVSLNGFGLTLTTVGDLVSNLKDSPHFGEVNYNRSQATTSSGRAIFNFDVKAPFIADPDKAKVAAEKAAKAKAEAEALKKQQQEARKKKPKRGG